MNKAKSNLLLGLGITLLGLTHSAVLAEIPIDPYPTEYAAQYLQDCLATSRAEGLAEPEAKKLCSCTLAEFQEQYSLEEFKDLNARAETEETAANDLVEVGQFCFESLLYE